MIVVTETAGSLFKYMLYTTGGIFLLNATLLGRTLNIPEVPVQAMMITNDVVLGGGTILSINAAEYPSMHTFHCTTIMAQLLYIVLQSQSSL
jgi:hypothetical protein